MGSRVLIKPLFNICLKQNVNSKLFDCSFRKFFSRNTLIAGQLVSQFRGAYKNKSFFSISPLLEKQYMIPKFAVFKFLNKTMKRFKILRTPILVFKRKEFPILNIVKVKNSNGLSRLNAFIVNHVGTFKKKIKHKFKPVLILNGDLSLILTDTV